MDLTNPMFNAFSMMLSDLTETPVVDLVQVLIENSAAAQSSKITIIYHPGESFSVQDNGRGFSVEAFQKFLSGFHASPSSSRKGIPLLIHALSLAEQGVIYSWSNELRHTFFGLENKPDLHAPVARFFFNREAVIPASSSRTPPTIEWVEPSTWWPHHRDKSGTVFQLNPSSWDKFPSPEDLRAALVKKPLVNVSCLSRKVVFNGEALP